MRVIFISIFLVISSIASAATYYVATNGSDSNPGTISAPFKTWQKGFTVAQPGDIVYVRGGTYYPTGTSGHDAYSGVYIRGKNGTSTKMINIWAYPGEKPILDCKNMTNAASHIGVYLDDCDYWYLKGLTIKNCLQTPGYGAHGLWLRTGNYNRFELIDISYVGGSGLCVLYEAEKNYIYNCDIHDCFDQYTKNSDGTPNPGEHADGVDLASITERPGNERVNTLRGVRAWNNSDDGFDHYNVDGVLIIDSCWVWHNGYNYGGTTPTGNGNGFKLGVANGTPESYAQRTVTNCIAYDNRQRGYSQEAANVNMIFYNNIAYKNKLQGFAFVAYNRPDVLRNNISYANSSNAFQSKQTHDHNSWDSGVTVSDADFASLDASQLLQPRKANGCLPNITFLALATGSDLIDKGVNVGIAYSGSAPDMGAFEKSSSTSAAPAYVSSVVPAATPTKLEITFSLALANIIPSSSSFTVMVNSASRSVSSVAVSGTKVTLTLSSPVVEGNTITVAYTKPSTNPLQVTSSTQVASFSAKTVTNSVSATATPVYVSSVVPSSTKLEITFSLTLASVLPSASSFTVMVNSASRSVSSVAVSGTKVTLTLSSSVAAGNTVTVAYTKPSSNPLQGTSSSQVASFSAKTVTNSVSTSTTSVQYVSSIVENATPTKLKVTYSHTLASTLCDPSRFAVRINSVARTVTAISISGTNVLLTLASPVAAGNVVTVGYTKPTTNLLVCTSGSEVPNMTAMPVTNLVGISSASMTYISSVVENATPTKLKVTYSQTLASTLCDPSRFGVKVNSVARTVTAISISGTNVILTLASSIAAGNVVTVGYLKPSTNLLVSTTGSQVPNMTAMPVTNLVGGSSSASASTPTYLSSAIVNPNLVALTYDRSLSPGLPPPSSFNVVVESNPVDVDAVEISGSNVLLTLKSPVSTGDEVILGYTIPPVNPIQSADSGQASNLDGILVANTIINAIPEYVSSVIETTSPDVLVLTYTLDLVNSSISTDAFTANVNGNSTPVSSVSIAGNTVTLTLPSKVYSNDNVTITYNKPVADPLQTISGGIATAFNDRAVNNKSNIKGEITIYPNPASDYINITHLEPSQGGRSVRILDYTGKLCLETALEPDNNNIPINLNKGVYIVQIVTGNIIRYAQKLIVR